MRAFNAGCVLIVASKRKSLPLSRLSVTGYHSEVLRNTPLLYDDSQTRGH